MEQEKLWYVVNAYSGHEDKVAENLKMRTESMDMENNIFRIIVPEQTEVEIKDGQKKEKVRKMFPGYVLVEMIMSDEAWYVVRNTPGVTGFIGSSGKGAKPIPLSPEEVAKILQLDNGKNNEIDTDIEIGDSVTVVDGPFKGMYVKVETLDKENQKLTVLIDLFGQETPVEVEMLQISRV